MEQQPKVPQQENYIDPYVCEMFTDDTLVSSLSEYIKSHPGAMSEFIKNCSLFRRAQSNPLLYGDMIHIPETPHGDGRTRPEQLGPEILVSQLKELGIDANRVLFFRRTQPTAATSNPELYWTSDYFETRKGLQAEIPDEQRATSVVLCSTLQEIASDSRLIRDVNDDIGISIRRERIEPYDQKRALAVIK